jgi:ankyrin repeat protein
MLLGDEANTNARNENEETTLHKTPEKGHKTIVHLLVEKRADADTKGKYGWTALHRVAEKGHEVVSEAVV